MGRGDGDPLEPLAEARRFFKVENSEPAARTSVDGYRWAMRTTLAVITMLALIPTLLGCTSSNARRAAVVGTSTPASGEVRGDIAYPRIAGSKRFTFEKSSWGSTESHTTVETYVPQDDGTWLIHTEDDGVRISSTHLARTAKGVSILDTVDYESATKTFFRGSGLLVMPTIARPEGLYGNTVTVEIYDLDNPHRIKQHGTATRDIEFLATELIVTPAGTFEAAHIRSVLLMELTSANVTQTDHLWIDSEIGIVAEDSRLQVRVFGLPFKSDSRLSLLAERPAVWREPSAAIGEPIVQPLVEYDANEIPQVQSPAQPQPTGVMRRMD